MTRFRIGTYNVENLYDRFDDPYELGDDEYGEYRTRPKSRDRLFDLGKRIQKSRVDVLGIQEVENFGALKDFVQTSVGPKFKVTKGIVTQQSNDRRGIDLGLISSLPIGRVISHRFNEFTLSTGKDYRFARDCLQVEILDQQKSRTLVTVLICHFKSKYSKFDPEDQSEEYERDQQASADKRNAEAKEVVRIAQSQFDPNTDCFAVLGDFNDTPDSAALEPLTGSSNSLGLVSAATLIDQQDEAPASQRQRARDTHLWIRADENGKEHRTWSQIDYILMSPALNALGPQAKVEPRGKGSDHRLFHVEVDA